MSGTPQPPVAVTTIREAVRRAVDDSSLRAVAEQVKVSHTVIVKLLAGSKPQAATMRKLLSWYVRQSVTMDTEAALASVELLVRGYPEAERQSVRAGLLDLLRKAHQGAGREPPEWLK